MDDMKDIKNEENAELLEKNAELLENKAINKYSKIRGDFWDKHNITTRVITLSSVILLFFIVLVEVFYKEITKFDLIFSTSSDLVLYLSLAIILGVNGTAKVLDVIAKIKGK